jgi:hypothetical protein
MLNLLNHMTMMLLGVRSFIALQAVRLPSFILQTDALGACLRPYKAFHNRQTRDGSEV